MSSSFQDFITVVTLFVTLPVTVASAERLFPKPKMIDNLLEVKVISITNEIVRNIDLEEIDAFAEMEARKVEFY
jgi:hypothetical protein